MCPLPNETGKLVTTDRDKAEVFLAFFTSVFTKFFQDFLFSSQSLAYATQWDQKVQLDSERTV